MISLYYRTEPERDRWIIGDRFVRPAVRRLMRGSAPASGVDKVVANLRLGFDRLGVAYRINPPLSSLQGGDRIAVLGRGRHALSGFDRDIPFVAGIALMTHPSEWPELCEEYSVIWYLQHSAWANEVYRPYFGQRCRVWPVGIDTECWRPSAQTDKTCDVLLYDKLSWRRDELVLQVLDPVRAALERSGLSYRTIRYGSYDERTYRRALEDCRWMIFLSERESQGLACQEALASGLPVLAWDPGQRRDQEHFGSGECEIPPTSVPYFDPRCGLRFRTTDEFAARLGEFLDMARAGCFAPRDYILKNLTLEQCAAAFVGLFDEAGAASSGSS